MPLTIGVDVGGTKIAAGLVDDQGNIVKDGKRDTPAHDAAAVEDAIAELVAELRGNEDVEAVGIGAAGFVDEKRATVLIAPNLEWRNERLKDEVERRTDLRVVVENDANAAAWGEFRFGAGEDVDDLVLVTVGTGVGGGIVTDGALFRGSFGVAAEIGHLRVVPNGHRCGCGNHGCWEQYASGRALEREAREFATAGSPMVADLLQRAGGDPHAISGPMVTDAAQDGDIFARELLQGVGRWLGEGIASLAALLDPAVVVLGGGVAAAGDLLLDPAREAFQGELTGRGYRPELEMRLATLGNTAGMIGAADLARQ